MEHLTQVLFALFRKLGVLGLVIVGVLDSSFLFAPLGNDLLVVGLVARKHSMPLVFMYAAASAAGSVLGCLLVDLVFRKAGEKGLEKHLSKRRLAYVKRKVKANAAWAVALASMAPPPFPFTPFVMASAALQYPRRRLLAIIAAARMARFTMIGVLAYFYGRRILKWAESDVVQWVVIGLVALCVGGSILSVIGWIRRSRRPAEGRPPESQSSPEPARQAL